MSKVIYDHAKPQVEVERENQEAQHQLLLSLLPTQYEGYKLTEMQRSVLEFIVQLWKSDDPKKRSLLVAEPVAAYAQAYLWVKFPTLSIDNDRHALRILTDLGESSPEFKEVQDWVNLVNELYVRLGYREDVPAEALDAKQFQLQNLQRAMNLTNRDAMRIWFEHMLANC